MQHRVWDGSDARSLLRLRQSYLRRPSSKLCIVIRNYDAMRSCDVETTDVIEVETRFDCAVFVRCDTREMPGPTERSEYGVWSNKTERVWGV